MNLKAVSIALFIANTVGNAASLYTFDELPTEDLPGLIYSTIPNGYGGLEWVNFGVLDGSILPASYGYHTGLASLNNVAYNLYGEPASICSSGGLFSLDSAYLTLALNLDTPLNIQVQGLVGTTLLYDNRYTVYRSGPTRIQFDYVGVDRVRFISSPEQQFALDNLTVTVPEPEPAIVGVVVCGLFGFMLVAFNRGLSQT